MGYHKAGIGGVIKYVPSVGLKSSHWFLRGNKYDEDMEDVRGRGITVMWPVLEVKTQALTAL